jgi:hypothetical protein
VSLSCAMAIAHLQRFPAPADPKAVQPLINSVLPLNLTPLSFVASFKLMEMINEHEVVAVTCSKALERMAGNLRIWIGSKEGEKSGLDRKTKRKMVERCLEITKRIVGMEDAGYETMSEEEIGGGC